jgi:hypothetical protein
MGAPLRVMRGINIIYFPIFLSPCGRGIKRRGGYKPE